MAHSSERLIDSSLRKFAIYRRPSANGADMNRTNRHSTKSTRKIRNSTILRIGFCLRVVLEAMAGLATMEKVLALSLSIRLRISLEKCPRELRFLGHLPKRSESARA